MVEERMNDQDDSEDMKKTFPYILVLLLLCLCGCKENDHIDYTLNDRVYFYETEKFLAVTNIVKEMNYTFSLKPSTLMEDTVKVNVRVMGRTADRDRHFKAVAVADSTTAQSPLHYEILDGVIPGGEYDGYLPVLLKRTADTKDHSVTLLLQIVDNEEFTTGNPDAINSVQANAAQKKIIHNLAGQRLEKTRRGVNIMDGQKVVVK